MSTVNRQLRVFVCHSAQDKAAARELYKKLRTETWIAPWLDEESLLPGQNWKTEIEKAIRAANAVLILLSNQSVSHEGQVQREIKQVLEVAEEKPEDTLFILTLRLEDCPVPQRLAEWHYIDYFPADRKDWAMERLTAALQQRAVTLELLANQNAGLPKPAALKSASDTGNAGITIHGNVIGSNVIVGNGNQVSSSMPAVATQTNPVESPTYSEARNQKIFAELVEALLDGFIKLRELEDLARALGFEIEKEIPLNSSLRDAALELVKWAKARDKLADLINIACEYNPTNKKLKQVSTYFNDKS